VSNFSAVPPRRGEIWFVRMPSDPPDKKPRPAVVVSVEARNRHPRADSVLVVPLSTTLGDVPTHLRLEPGETGLAEPCSAQAENITTVRKGDLAPMRGGGRTLGSVRIRQLASRVVLAMGVLPADLAQVP